MGTIRVGDGFLNLLPLTVLACAATLAACSPTSDTVGATSGPDAVLGIWVPDAAPERLLAADGSPPPLTGEAAAMHAARLELVQSGDTFVRPDHVVCRARHAPRADHAVSVRDPPRR